MCPRYCGRWTAKTTHSKAAKDKREVTHNVRHLLALDRLSTPAIEVIINDGIELAGHWRERTMPDSLAGRRVGLIVDDDGWRNTFAFDLGVQSMGGICVQAPIRFGTREATGDLARYLGNWCDAVVVRTARFEDIAALANDIEVPVVNARTQSNHPCEILGDLTYVRTQRSLEDLKVAVVSPESNILRSWVEASIVLPIDVIQVFSAAWHLDDPALAGARFATSTDMSTLAGADVLVTDAWPEGDFGDYRVTCEVLERLGKGAVFLPCPPVHRGAEVSAEAMNHPACQSFAAKAYLLHAQNAVLRWALGSTGEQAP
jgi:ornithine carbamoyltransferase